MEIIRDKKLEDSYMVATICNMRSRGDLRTDYKTQRNPDTWTNEYRDGFVSSMIKGEDCDSIKICEQIKKNGVTLWIIDGGHRVTTLEKYRKNGFSLGSSIERSIVKYQVFEQDEGGNFLQDEDGERIIKVVEFDLKGKGYSDLPIELKERFDNKKIDYVKHLDCTDEDIAYHMRRYNKQKSMNASEMAITYMPEMAEYLKNISKKNRFFKDCGTYSPTNRINGNFDRIVMETIMCTNHLHSWKSNGKSIAAWLENNSSKEEFALLNNNLKRLIPLVCDKYDDLFTTKNTFIFLTLFNKFVGLGIEDKRFESFLSEFKSTLHNKTFEEYENLSFTEYDKNKGTKDKKTIIAKLDILEKLMMEFLHINIEETEVHSNDSCIRELVFETVEEMSVIDFVRANVKSDVTEDDISFYNDLLDEYVKIDSPIREVNNIPSLISIVAYSCETETDIEVENWFKDFVKRNIVYIKDQKNNFLHMLNDFKNYLQSKEKLVAS